MLNQIATVKDDGTVVVNVPSTLEATPIDVGAVGGYEDVVVEESFCSQPLISQLASVIQGLGVFHDGQPCQFSLV